MSDLRDSASPFGVLDFLAWNHDWNHHHYPNDGLDPALALMREAGVSFVRSDFLWSDLEPRAGEWNFAKYDRLVDQVRGHGLCLLGVLVYSPAWKAGPWNQPPDPEAYVQYARTVVHRYKDRVRHWQIWNEPDHEEYWQPQDELRSYLKLLMQVSPALKEEDPTCRVHLGGLSRALPRSLKNIYDGGGRAFFDIADIHMFINPLTPDALGSARYLYEGARRLMDGSGDQAKPIWLTEFGCPGMRDPKAAPDWWLGKNPSEAVQAEWVRTAYTQALRWPGIEKVFWAFFRDTQNHFKTGVDHFGLIRHDFTKKPAYDAYRHAASSGANLAPR
jgi:hypothetical protein